MTRDECLRMIEEALDLPPNSLREDMELSEQRGWDSVGRLSLMAAFDAKLGIAVKPTAFSEAKFIGDLLEIAKEKLE